MTDHGPYCSPRFSSKTFPNRVITMSTRAGKSFFVRRCHSRDSVAHPEISNRQATAQKCWRKLVWEDSSKMVRILIEVCSSPPFNSYLSRHESGASRGDHSRLLILDFAIRVGRIFNDGISYWRTVNG